MTLSGLLENELILLKTACTSKEDLIGKLVDRIFSTNHDLPLPKEDVIKTIYIRELIGGTMLPSGLSVPHARLKNYEGFTLCLGIPAEPLFHEGIQIRMLSLMITSQSGTPWYLPALAALTKISREEELFSRLCGAETTDEFISMLREKEVELT